MLDPERGADPEELDAGDAAARYGAADNAAEERAERLADHVADHDAAGTTYEHVSDDHGAAIPDEADPVEAHQRAHEREAATA